jgi:hypothetical protein
MLVVLFLALGEPIADRCPKFSFAGTLLPSGCEPKIGILTKTEGRSFAIELVIKTP